MLASHYSSSSDNQPVCNTDSEKLRMNILLRESYMTRDKLRPAQGPEVEGRMHRLDQQTNPMNHVIVVHLEKEALE